MQKEQQFWLSHVPLYKLGIYNGIPEGMDIKIWYTTEAPRCHFVFFVLMDFEFSYFLNPKDVITNSKDSD